MGWPHSHMSYAEMWYSLILSDEKLEFNLQWMYGPTVGTSYAKKHTACLIKHKVGIIDGLGCILCLYFPLLKDEKNLKHTFRHWNIIFYFF